MGYRFLWKASRTLRLEFGSVEKETKTHLILLVEVAICEPTILWTREFWRTINFQLVNINTNRAIDRLMKVKHKSGASNSDSERTQGETLFHKYMVPQARESMSGSKANLRCSIYEVTVRDRPYTYDHMYQKSLGYLHTYRSKIATVTVTDTLTVKVTALVNRPPEEWSQDFKAPWYYHNLIHPEWKCLSWLNVSLSGTWIDTFLIDSDIDVDSPKKILPRKRPVPARLPLFKAWE